MTIETNYSLKRHNTFGIDAYCQRYVEYTSVEELQSALTELQGAGETRLLHIGGGSNLLFTADFPGTILHSAIRGMQVIREVGEQVWLRVGAGEDWDTFVGRSIATGLYGLENLSLIPGEVGASAVQNIGAYGVEACQFIDTVEAVSLRDGTPRTFSVEECNYAYRNSIFKQELRSQYAITHVTYRLSRTFHPNLDYAAVARELSARNVAPEALTAQQLRQIICEVRRAKLPDPATTGSAGSFFMNPVISHAQWERLHAQWPGAPHYDVAGGVKVPAGWLIEQTGWKGRRLGTAGVWPKQALVLVNLGEATGSDIVRLCDTIRHDVKEKFGIDLTPEVNFI